MPEEKKSRGRPRLYKDDAEKHRVFRQKKKEQFQQLEEKVKELEALVERDLDLQEDKKQPWYDWTFQDINRMSTKQLQEYKKEIKKIIKKITILSPIKVIVEDVLEKSKEALESGAEYSKKLIRNEVFHIAREFDNSLFNSTILHMIDLELVSRTSAIDFDYEIEIAEQRISELEEEIKEKKRLKVGTSSQTEKK